MQPIASSIVVLAGSLPLATGSFLATTAHDTSSLFGWADLGVGASMMVVGLLRLSSD
jgi:hypothetical protein